MFRYINIKIFILFIAVITTQGASRTQSTECITNFNSLIVIHPDGSMTVTETIHAAARGIKIRRGIYRTFPIIYRDRFGNAVRVHFDVERVERDGKPEPFHITREDNNIKVYIGDKNIYLTDNTYVYTLVYRTNRQLRHFNDFDELYWNVTGNEWDFTINEAKATITLPKGAAVKSVAGYTGKKGEQGKKYSIQRELHQISITTTASLSPGEGLTVAVSWPKGFVKIPTPFQKVNYFIKDNPLAIIGIAGNLLLFLYYMIVWFKVGKDPEKGTIIPRFAPPHNISPAAANFISEMEYTHTAFAAALVNMAVKGFITINERNENYTLNRTDAPDTVLTSDEKVIALELFSESSSITIRGYNYSQFKAAKDNLKDHLKQKFEKVHFWKNSRYTIPGIILSIIVCSAMIMRVPSENVPIIVSMIIFLIIWSFMIYSFVKSTLTSWISAYKAPGGLNRANIKDSIFISCFTLPFLGADILVLFMLTQILPPPAVMLLLLMASLNILFYHLLKAPTILGRKVLDELDGFRMYLGYTEGDKLNLMNQPTQTPELFEKFLPYAIAFEIENAWSYKFTSTLNAAIAKNSYSPCWYSGKNSSINDIIKSTSSLGTTLSTAISSSSAPRSSSSGSSGSGSSGGGGGSSGGGGW